MRVGRKLLLVITASWLLVPGCLMWPLPEGLLPPKGWHPGPDFHKAAFTMKGNQLMVRNDDTELWHAATVTLDTDHGYFRQKAGDMTAGDVRALPLESFRSALGEQPNTTYQVKSVWVHATYPDGRIADEMAFPAAEFGYKPVTKPGT